MSRSHAGFFFFFMPRIIASHIGVALPRCREPFIKTASKRKPDQGLTCSLSEDVLDLYAHMPLPQVQISGFRTAALGVDSRSRPFRAMSTRGVVMHSLGSW
ncbi:hypothetical protein THAR02_11179 [Trichoderma harzianum]|uniref:Secreted protein n=1 Tax=Trichoderma harzianum TaxID=5544 RepID=A0A0F9X7B6_TRIHA|nr:hypothetical protein THAR02_11179 [Trichoderma harzianum]